MPEPWIVELKERFDFNLARVRGIVDAYERLGSGAAGRPSVQRTDLLRSAVVFLHAALEDSLRSLAEERLPLAAPEVLERIPLYQPNVDKPVFKFSLKELAAFRSETVATVIRQAVDAYLRYSNYNNTDEIATLLRQVGIDGAAVTHLLAAYGGALESMMARRHMIVHRADRNPRKGRGQHTTNPLGRDAVIRWIDSVEGFAGELIGQFNGGSADVDER